MLERFDNDLIVTSSVLAQYYDNKKNIDTSSYRRDLKTNVGDIVDTVTEKESTTVYQDDLHSNTGDSFSPDGTPLIEKTPLGQSDSNRKKATSSKRKRQEVQAEKMMRYRNAQCANVDIGAVVTISLDKRDFTTGTGVRAVVFDAKERTGGILACCESGIISQKNGHHYWIPSDRYGVTSLATEDAVLTEALNKIRKQILDRTFDRAKVNKVTLVQAQKTFMGRSPRKKGSCNCKGGKCTHRCGCRRNKNSMCSSTCSCSGNCRL